eukprot:1146830-Pelagomonas_calceolata.AAC.2
MLAVLLLQLLVLKQRLWCMSQQTPKAGSKCLLLSSVLPSTFPCCHVTSAAVGVEAEAHAHAQAGSEHLLLSSVLVKNLLSAVLLHGRHSSHAVYSFVPAGLYLCATPQKDSQASASITLSAEGHACLDDCNNWRGGKPRGTCQKDGRCACEVRLFLCG